MKIPIIFLVVTMGCWLACSGKKTANDTGDGMSLEEVKQQLFKPIKNIDDLPVYVDPPTDDYKDFATEGFSFQVSDTLLGSVRNYRKELEPLIVARIEPGYHGLSWAYLAAYLKYESAIPSLKEWFLNETHFYGWEGYDYDDPESYFVDNQYPRQMALIAVMEYIAGKPLPAIIVLTGAEMKSLELQASGLDRFAMSEFDREEFREACAACWKLEKLKPGEAEGQYWRACVSRVRVK